jgi:septum site-determining protein MinD
MERTVAVVSGKGGVGKTTFTANTGLALRELGHEVVLVDADLATSNLGLHLGLFQFPAGLQDALQGRIGIENVLYTHASGMRVIPSSISMAYMKSGPSPSRMRALLRGLRGFVLVDSPPGLGKEVAMVLKACAEAVVVTNPELPAVTDAMKACRMAEGMGVEVRGVVLNRAGGRYGLTREEVEDMCGQKVIGIVPEDRAMRRSVF